MTSEMAEDARLRLLNLLLDAFERRWSPSATEPAEPRKPVSVRFTRERMPEYWNDQSSEALEAYNSVAIALESDGIVKVEWRKDARNRLLQKVTLTECGVSRAYGLVHREPLEDRVQRLVSVVTAWLIRWESDDRIEPWLPSFAESLLARATEGKSFAGFGPGDDRELDAVCKGLDAAVRLQKDTSYRVFSARVLGDSKALEAIAPRLERVVREFHPRAEDSLDEHKTALALIGLLPNPQLTMLSGHCELVTSGHPRSMIDVSQFPELALTDRGLDLVQGVVVHAKRILTIENLASFYQWVEYSSSQPAATHEPTLAVYVGGFLTRSQQRFASLLEGAISENNGALSHWGDIDGGGFRILRQIEDAAGVKVQPFLMGAATFLKYRERGKPCKESHLRQVSAMLQNPRYSDHSQVLELILTHRITIEQESIDLEKEMEGSL